MKKPTLLQTLLSVAATGLLLTGASAQAQVNEDAAMDLARKSNCMKCHSVQRDKQGPSFTSVAAKYKGKADGEAEVTKMITTVHTVKFKDGTEDEHAIVQSKDEAEIKNLVQWILSR